MSVAGKATCERGPYQPLVPVLIAVCAGTMVDRWIASPPLVAWFVAAALLALWWCAWRRGWLQWSASCLLVSLLSLAAAWHHCRWFLFDDVELARATTAAAQPVCLEAIALTSPRRLPAPAYNPMRTLQLGERSRMPVVVTAVRDGGTWREASGSATLLVDGHLLGVGAGDRVRVFGQLAKPPTAANPGEFDFALHLRGERQLCQVRSDFPECVSVVEPGSKWTLSRAVDSVRSRGHGLLWRHLERQRAGLAAAMFLGIREELAEDDQEAFLETGTIHLLVISGLNVGILAMCFFFLHRLGLLSLTTTLVVTAVLTTLYAIVTDAQPPVVRATVMVLVACVARALGRQALDWNTLAAAALAVLALNPCELFRAGTQLSFLSVAALLFVQRNFWRENVDALDRLIAASRPWQQRAAAWLGRWAWRATVLSAVIWLVVLPLVMARFHLVSPSAVLLGPILAVPVTIAMAAGFVVLIVGWLIPPLGALAGWCCDWSLASLEIVVDAVRNVPGSHYWVSGPGDWWLAGFYFALGAFALCPHWRPRHRWSAGLCGAWIIAGLGWPAVGHTPAMECTFLSVGHGCAVVVHTPSGKTLLYDAGRLGSPVQPTRAITGYLWSRGITHLDAVVVSHADADHYNALPEVLERISVGVVYVSPQMFEEPSGAVAALQQAIEEHGVPMRTIYAGDRLRADDDCRIEVLHPPKLGVLGTDNANSIVLDVEHAGRRVLLTGDLETPGLQDVLAEEPLDCDIVLAPHHGSRFSDPPGLADWATPEFVVISGGERDRAEEVLAAYQRRGTRVLHTQDVGAMTFELRSEAVTLSWFRE